MNPTNQNAPMGEILGKTTEDAFTVTHEQTGELQVSRQASLAQHEIQSAIIVAKRFPRNEDQAFQSLKRACKRTSFAMSAEFKFPRGGATVTGPSANIAREAARCWTNLRYGTDIVADTPDKRSIINYAWDVENNIRVEEPATFEKKVQRKNKATGQTEWVQTSDERDLRELTNKYASIGQRNCILRLLPKDLIEDAIAQCRATLRSEAAQDPDGLRKRIIDAFDNLNITVKMLEELLGHPISQCTPDELDTLRGVWKSIEEGNSTWGDYVNKAPAEEVAAKSADRLAAIKERARQAKPEAQQPVTEVPPQPPTVTVEPETQTPPAPRRRGQAGDAPTSADLGFKASSTVRYGYKL